MLDNTKVFDVWVVVPRNFHIRDIFNGDTDIPADDTLLKTKAIRRALKLVDTRFPGNHAVSTLRTTTRKLLHFRVKRLRTLQQLEYIFAFTDTNMRIAAVRSAYKIDPVVTGQDGDGNDIIEMQYKIIKSFDKATILPFIPDKKTFDLQGNGTSSIPVTVADDIYAPQYGGTEPWLV